MPSARDHTWSVVHAERRALAGDLDGLSRAQWDTPSLCPGWSVHDVLAHLIDVATTTRLGFVRRMLGARFNLDRDNVNGVVRERFDDPARTLEAFRAVVDRTSTPPAPLATRVIEEILHGEDIRRPLGIRRDYPIDQVVAALLYLLRTTVRLGGGKERAVGLRLVAVDADVQTGGGDEVRGTALALLLAASGRPVGPGEVTGRGAERLLIAADGSGSPAV